MTDAFQLHSLAAGKQTRKARTMTAVVEVTRVHPTLMQRAREAASGDMTRVEILGVDAVMIWNTAEQKALMMARAVKREQRRQSRRAKKAE